jgi:MATE family multidrug resistance protein
MNKRILKLAIPNIISNISVPLAGMIDLALMGYLEGAVDYVAAISLGGMIFNFLYATFVFLRMTTTGFTSQAYGRRDFKSSVLTLSRALSVAFISAIALIALQIPLERLAFSIISTEPEVAELTRQYFFIRIWAAPATIGLYALLGWFIGMQNAKTPMIISIAVNILNFSLSALFIMVFGMKSEGVALGTLLAQYSGLFIALFVLLKHYRKLFKYWQKKAMFKLKELFSFFNVSKDILIRTICLIGVFTFFTSESAAANKHILSINSLLLQFLMLFSYLIDGFAYAAEALTGKYIGSGNKDYLRNCIKHLFKWGWGLAIIFVIIYAVARENILYVLTNESEIIEGAKTYIIWTILLPISGFGAYLWDGIYIGATASKEMRNSMLLSVFAVFAPTYFIGSNYIGNHALWLALILFMLARGFFLRLMSTKAIYMNSALTKTKV